jgi:hypothetical protein
MKNLFERFKRNLIPQQPAVGSDASVAATATSFIPVTAVKRDAILGFIIQALQPYVDERSLSVAGLRLYVRCHSIAEEESARVALCTDKPNMFRNQYLQRKLLNHFIQLEPDWFFEYEIVEELPAGCIREGNFALKIVRAGEHKQEHFSTAFIRVLAGQTEQQEYTLDPRIQVKYHIGRSKQPQLSSGKVRLNDIVFLGKEDAGFNETQGSANLCVSRNHAFILYDPATDKYLLYPDKGGLPDNGNKLKVHTADDKIKWLNIYGMAHVLQDGDQIELGGAAVLLFKM